MKLPAGPRAGPRGTFQGPHDDRESLECHHLHRSCCASPTGCNPSARDGGQRLWYNLSGDIVFYSFWFFPANAEVWYLQRDMLQNLDHKWFDAQIHRFLVYATIKQSFFRRSVCRFQQPFCLIIPNIQPSAAQHSGRKPCTPMAPLGIKNCPQIATIPAARPAQVAWAWSWKPPCMKDFPLPRLIIKGYITIYSNLLVSKWVKSPQLELG